MKFSVDVSVEERGKKKPQYSIDTDLNGEVSLAEFLLFTKQTLLVTADFVLKEEQGYGFDPHPVVVVDGKTNKPIINVSPVGQIEFVARAQMKEIILATYQGLLDRSKVLTGRYKQSHFVFLNGNQVAVDLVSLEAWINSNPEFKPTDLIRFVDIQPYARKLERLGVTAQRTAERTYIKRDKNKKVLSTRPKQPNGVYFQTARSIKAKFKRNAGIKFTFIAGSQLGITSSFKSRGGKPGRTYLYPSIVLTLQEGGTL